MEIIFHTGYLPENKIDDVVIIDANRIEDYIVRSTERALNDACVPTDCGSTLGSTNIFSNSELALTTVRVWCKTNDMSIRIFKWIDGVPVVSTIDTDGRIEGEYPFSKNVELLMELM